MNISKIIIISLIAVTSLSISGMEQDPVGVEGDKKIVKSAPSLKFIAANWLRKHQSNPTVVTALKVLPADIKEYLTELEQLIARYKMFQESENLQENPQQALFNACELCTTQIVPDLVTLGADVNGVFYTKDGFVTPLMVAVVPFSLEYFGITIPNLVKITLRNGELIDRLISLGAQIDKLSSHSKQSALHYAAEQGNSEAVITLVNHGACVDGSPGSLRTPLHYAVGIHHPILCTEIMSFLLKNGANINATDFNGSAPLLYAVFTRNIEAIKCILQHAANVTLTNSNLNSELQLAQELDAHTIIELLLKHQAAQEK